MANRIAGPSRSRSESPGPSSTSIKPEGFTILYSGEGNILADVVFVHGLRGHPERTWTKEVSSHPDNSRKLSTLWAGVVKRRKVNKQTNSEDGRSVLWPRDLLPAKVANIRILTYGYDSNVVLGKNKNGIYQHAENMLSALERIRLDLVTDPARKIIFVAHSLGGVIVKEVLRQSSNHTHQAHLLAIFKDTYGLIFLGCPHRGSSAAEWGVIAANIVKLGGLSSNTDLLRSLGTDSQALSLLSLDFSRFMRDRSFKVHSFREEQGMTGIAGISGKVVEDASSIIGDAEEGKEGINANHRDMGRFGSIEEEGFLKVAGVISRYVKDVGNIQNSLKHVARQELKRTRGRNIGDLSKDEIKCLQSLTNADYSTYRRRVARRHPGTLDWVLEHQVYQEWVSRDTLPSLLWISGNPGCGKTVMSAFLLDYLENRVNGTDVNLAYFFCDDKEQSQKSGQSILRGVIHQLITTTPGLIKHAMGYHKAHGPKILESLDLLWNVFIFVATDPLCEGAYIVLDALDECEKDSRDDLLRRFNNYFLSEANKTTQPYLKVLVTSRPYPEIERLLSKRRTIRLKTEDEGQNINADITSFISHHVNELAEICDYTPTLKETVRNKLENGADGMFLWVSLIVQELLETPASLVSETLETTPNTITGVYTHLLKRLTGNKVKIASKILTWVVMAPAPMTVTELAIACTVKITDEEESSIDRALIAGFERDIALCGPILKVQHGVVHLVHQSAKDFLLHLGVRDCIGDFRIIPERASLELAITCLTYLSFSDWDGHKLSKFHAQLRVASAFHDVERRSQLPPDRTHDFHLFAAKSWPRFVRQTDEGDPDLWWAFCRLSRSSVRLVLAFHRDIDTIWKDLSLYALYVSSYYGFCSISRCLLDTGADVNAQDTNLRNALQAASSNGHEPVVLLLLDRGADVNAQGGDHGNALQAASSNGHEQVVLLLLDHGADVNAQGGLYGNALQTASAIGHKQVVLLLLDRGADVNAQGVHYGNALQAASWKGHEQVVLLLLDRGADVNAQCGDYGNALQAASLNGHQEVALLLLDRGADVNAQGGDYGNALQAASLDGHEQVVLLLLDRGADVNAQGGLYGNALQAASLNGHQEVVLLLLDHNAGVNAQGGYFGNALQAASLNCHQEVVLLLLDRGADVNAQGGDYGNALQAASLNCDQEVVLLLLDRGADVNAQGGDYGNALQAASSEGHKPVALLLLDHGADVNAQGGLYGNALQTASAIGHEQVVLLLLDRGADVNAQGGYHGNALQAASSNGHEQVVLRLFDRGANVNALCGYFGNALQAASSNGHEQVVLLLLDRGADVNAQGGYFGNALQAASSNGHEQVVLLLLDRGADVNAQGGHYGNALQAASSEGHEQVVLLLLDRGTDVNAQGGYYGNALKAAERCTIPAIVNLLLQYGATPN